MARVCRILKVPRSTVYANKKARANSAAPPRKRGPRTKLSDAELTEKIRELLTDPIWQGEGHRKVWARLRFAGIRVWKERVLRWMREAGLLAPCRAQRVLGPRNHDGAIIPELPNQMWGTDLTTTFLEREGQVAVFVAVDHAGNDCVGIHAAKHGNRFEALEPIYQGTKDYFGSLEPAAAAGLKLRHDHGSCYVSDHFQGAIRFFGIEPSPAFVRAPEGNGCAERFIRIVKEQLLWVRKFATVEELRSALLEFKDKYNKSWIVERHGFLTPAKAREKLLSGQHQAA